MSDFYNDIIIDSSVSLRRNLNNYPFCEKMTPAQKNELLSNLMQYIKNKAHLLPCKFNYNEAVFLSEREFNFLKDYLKLENFNKTELSSIGIFKAESDKISVVINNNEHIGISALSFGLSLNEAYEKIKYIDNLICDELPLAFNKKIGYLFSELLENGTGMDAYCTMHLPALEHTSELKRYSESMKNFGIKIDKTGEFGSIYKVRNVLKGLVDENEYLENLTAVVRNLAYEEKAARETMFITDEIKKSIVLAVEALKNSMELNYDMLLQMISLVKIGISEGFISGINIGEIEKYMDILRDSSIEYSYEDENKDRRRAKLIKSIFEKVYY